MSTQEFTETLPEHIPPADAVIALARQALEGGIAREQAESTLVGNMPVLGLLAPVPVLADWLGVKESTIYQARYRTRADGATAWPKEDDTILGRKMWRFSTIALDRAATPGRGWNLRSEARTAQ